MHVMAHSHSDLCTTAYMCMRTYGPSGWDRTSSREGSRPIPEEGVVGVHSWHILRHTLLMSLHVLIVLNCTTTHMRSYGPYVVF